MDSPLWWEVISQLTDHNVKFVAKVCMGEGRSENLRGHKVYITRGINYNKLYNSSNLRIIGKNCLAETKMPGTEYSVHGNFILPSTTRKLYV